MRAFFIRIYNASQYIYFDHHATLLLYVDSQGVHIFQLSVNVHLKDFTNHAGDKLGSEVAALKISHKWLCKKLHLPYHAETSIPLRDLLRTYVQKNTMFAFRHHRDTIKMVLQTFPHADEKMLLNKLQRLLIYSGKSINPQGTLALILRYIDAKNNALDNGIDRNGNLIAAHTASMNQEVYDQIKNKLDIHTSLPDLSFVGKAKQVLEAYCNKPFLSRRHDANIILVNQVLTKLDIQKDISAQNYYDELVIKIARHADKISPQGTLAMVLKALEGLAGEEERLKTQQDLGHSPAPAERLSDDNAEKETNISSLTP